MYSTALSDELMGLDFSGVFPNSSAERQTFIPRYWVVLSNLKKQNKVGTRCDRKNTILGSEDLGCVPSSTLRQIIKYPSTAVFIPGRWEAGLDNIRVPLRQSAPDLRDHPPCLRPTKPQGTVRAAQQASPGPQYRHGQVLQSHLRTPRPVQSLPAPWTCNCSMCWRKGCLRSEVK